jgi:hypothetical protein
MERASARDQQEIDRCVQPRDDVDSCFSNDMKSPSLNEETVDWIFPIAPMEMTEESTLRVGLYMPLGRFQFTDRENVTWWSGGL